MSGDAVRYGEWSKDRQGWFLGLSGGALLVVAVTGMPLLLAVGAHRWGFAAGWLLVWGVVVVMVAVPVHGRPASRWAIDAGYRAVGDGMGWTSWRSSAATGGGSEAAADLPGVLAGIRTHDGPPFGATLARPVIVQDGAAGTWAVVAAITHPGIGLAEPAARARMAAGLSELTEAAATGELVSVLALQVRTVPDDGAERAAWQARNLRDDAPALARRVDAELSGAVVQAGVRLEQFLTVVVPEAAIGRQAKEAGGGVDGRARVLYGVMAEVEARLLGPMGCDSVSWLDSAALAAAIRTGFAPGERAGLTEATLTAGENTAAEAVGEALGRLAARGLSVEAVARMLALDVAEVQRLSRLAGALPMGAAGPSSAPAPERRHYVHDAWSTVTCTVLLPEQGALMGALAPVFTPSAVGERRSATVFFQALPRQRADRLVGAESMSADTAADLRARLGFRTRAAHRRDAARVAGQDTRLAAGRALVRQAMAASVTVPSTWPVADYGRRLEASIRGAGFTPLRLDLAQDSGFAAACIPLGVGMPARRGVRR